MKKFFKHLTFVAFASTGIPGLAFTQIGKASFTIFYVTFLMLFFTQQKNNQSGFKITKHLIDYKIWIILVSIILCSLLNSDVSRLTSVIYSVMWISIYLILLIIYRKLKIEDFIYVLKLTIIVNLVYTILGILTIMAGMHSMLSDFFVVTDNLGLNRPKGITTEPSYSAFVSSICYLALLSMVNYKFDYKMFIVFILSIVCIQSAFGYVFLAVILFGMLFRKYFTKKHIVLLLGSLLTITISVIYLSFELDILAIKRVLEPLNIFLFSNGTFYDKLNSLRMTDASPFFRIGPTALYLKEVSLTDIKFYFGHGAGSSGAYFGKMFIDYVHGEDLDTGLIPGFLYDYGVVTCGIVMLFIYSELKKAGWEAKLIIFLFLFNASFNTQIFWFYIFLFSMIRIIKFRTAKKRLYVVPAVLPGETSITI